MRTKTLLIAAAALAAGLASSMAQAVYSQNVVGYYNVTVSSTGPAGTSLSRYKIIANQLNKSDMTLNGVLGTNLPPGTLFYPFDPSIPGYATAAELIDDVTGWDPNYTLPLGKGGFIRNLAGADMTVTFVGEVAQGSVTNTVWPTGYSIMGSAIPQGGLVQAALKFPGNEAGGDFITQWVPGTGFTTANEYLGGNAWDPAEPNVGVGEGFFVRRLSGGGTNWVRNFTVQ
jgi:hypothetical protein